MCSVLFFGDQGKCSFNFSVILHISGRSMYGEAEVFLFESYSFPFILYPLYVKY